MIQHILDMFSAVLPKKDSPEDCYRERQRSTTVNLPYEGGIPASEVAKFQDNGFDRGRFPRKFSEGFDSIYENMEVPRAVSRHFSHLSIASTASGVAGNTVSRRHLDAEGRHLSKTLSDSMRLVTKDFEWEMFNIRSCLWNTRTTDMYLCVGASVFPVHKSVLSLHSCVFHDVIFKVCKERMPGALPMLTLIGHDVEELREVLTCFYFPSRKLRGETIECVLHLAKELHAKELLRMCERALLVAKGYDVYSLLGLADTYKLTKLMAQTVKEASCIENIHIEPRFMTLTTNQRQAIMLNMVKKRLLSMNEALERSKSMECINNNDDVLSRDRLYSLTEVDIQ